MKRSFRLLIGVVVAMTLATPAAAQQIAQHPRVIQASRLIEVWLDAQLAYEQIPGISAGVVHDQDLLWDGGFGLANVERKVEATPSTIYSVCSISKLFTSIGVMQLRDAGKLRLDDPVSRHLSWFEIRQSDSTSGDVTIEGLLTHASGLPRESDHAYWTGPDFVFPTRDQIIERVSSQQTLYPAATYFQYSNLGLALAGEVVSAASNLSYDEYTRRNILEPLGMTSTWTDMPSDQRGGRLAVGYSAPRREGGRVPVPFYTARGVAAAAGFASTVEDLARLASWQFRVLEREGGEQVLRANTLREMHRVHWVDPDFESTRGLGFSVWRDGSKTFVGHGGSCPGYRTNLLLRPEDQIATIFMTNAQGVNASAYTQRMYDIMAPAILAARDTARAPKQPDSTLVQYTGSYESGFAGEIAVVAWEDGLAALSLPTMDPLRGLSKLEREEGHTFRRKRGNDVLGEAIVFVIGPDGKATEMIWHSNRYRRTR